MASSFSRLLHSCTRKVLHSSKPIQIRESKSRFASSSSTSDSRYNVITPPPAPLSKGKQKSAIARQKNDQSGTDWRRNDMEKVEILDRFRSTLSSGQDGEAWSFWLDLCNKRKQMLLNDDDRNKLRMILEKNKNSGERLLQLLLDSAENNRWKVVIECLKTQIVKGQFDFAFTMSSEVLSRLKDESKWKPARSELAEVVMVAAIACAHQDQPSVLPLIRLVRPMTPYKINLAGSKETSTKGFSGNGSPLSIPGSVNFMKSFIPFTPSVQEALHFCRHAILAWGLDYKSSTLKEGGNSLARRFGLLFKANDPSTVDMLLSTAKEATSEDYGKWLTMTAYHDINADWNDMTWFTLFSSSIAQQRTEIAAKAWSFYNTLKPSTEPPSNRIWNALLDGYSQSRQWDSMMKTWEDAKASKNPLDAFNYTTMMTGLFRANLSNEAMMMLDEMKEKAKRGEIELTTESINSVIHGLLYNNRVEDATQLFSQVCSGNEKATLPKPNISTINTFLRAYGRHGDIEKIIAILRKVTELGLEPDVITFTTVLDAFSRAEMPGGVDQVYQMMLDSNVRESNVTLTTLIRTIMEVKEGDPDIALALTVLDKMEKQGPYPTEVTYTTIISGLFAHSELVTRLAQKGSLPPSYQRMIEPEEGESSPMDAILAQHRPEVGLSLEVVKQMRKRGLKFNRVTYHTLLSGLFSEKPDKGQEGVRKANLLCLKKAMEFLKDLYVSPGANEDTWKLVLSALIRQRNSRDRALSNEAQIDLQKTIAKIESLGKVGTSMDRRVSVLMAEAQASRRKTTINGPNTIT